MSSRRASCLQRCARGGARRTLPARGARSRRRRGTAPSYYFLAQLRLIMRDHADPVLDRDGEEVHLRDIRLRLTRSGASPGAAVIAVVGGADRYLTVPPQHLDDLRGVPDVIVLHTDPTGHEDLAAPADRVGIVLRNSHAKSDQGPCGEAVVRQVDFVHGARLPSHLFRQTHAADVVDSVFVQFDALAANRVPPQRVQHGS
mmetsp:Transcript_41876/g.115420  ORF Transcript_41876/g.115420 Transcript_41876/m.115420 type:complete len:201 (+) Transcript_41876:1612-2214(+)